MVLPTAATHRVLLQRAHTRRGLAGVANHRTGARNRRHPRRGQSRDTAKVAEQIKCRAFSSQQIVGRAGYRNKYVATFKSITITGQAWAEQLRIEAQP